MEWIVCPPGARFVDRNMDPVSQAEDWFYLHVDNAPVTKMIYDGGVCKCPYNDPECETVLMTFEDFKQHTLREDFKELKTLTEFYDRLDTHGKHRRDTDAVILPANKVVETKTERCPVCLNFLGIRFQFHPCHHTFCPDCLEKINSSRLKCPMCRADPVRYRECECFY
jgi:hypothetical protein